MAYKKGDTSHFAGTKTLCWECQNACGGCSWSQSLTPVKGWTARERDMTVKFGARGYYIEHIDHSYIVDDCPEFKAEIIDKRRMKDD